MDSPTFTSSAASGPGMPDPSGGRARTRFVREAVIAPRAMPAAAVPAYSRWRRIWFPSAATGLLSLLLLALLAAGGWRFLEWAFVHAHWAGATSEACQDNRGACWAFVAARWKPWLVGDYPSAQLWRPLACFATFALFWTWAVRRSHTASLGLVLLGFVLLPVFFFLLLLGGIGLPFVPPTRWGGLLLTLVVSLATFATALPLGLALALGRRSRLPVVRWLCAGFVESMRSVPLLVLLFIAATLLPMFLPSGWSVDLFTRAVAAFVLFNAALAAEVFRGGLQAIGRGQYEAATTVGLSDLRALALVVLPQAVTAVVPALVNVMVAIVKETTLLSVIGVNDLMGAIETGSKAADWVGDPNILTSGHVFLALIYLTVCYGMSHYSRRLEGRR